jgi:DNA-directed RNA polymerase sigma subunit (sigma70/sigma32)
MPVRKQYNRRRCSLDLLPLDRIADQKAVPPEGDNQSDLREDRRNLAEQLVGTLHPRDAYIIRSSFGLGEVQTDKTAIARQLGITPQAVSKRVPALLERLRRAASTVT